MFFLACTLLEDGLLVGFRLGNGVELVEGDHEENYPFEPAEVLVLTNETAGDRSWRGQHGKP